MTAKLTAKEAGFVAEYLVDKNGTKAAERASYKNARIAAQRMLKRPHIQAALRAALKAQQERTLITADANLLAIDRLAKKAEKAQEFGAAIRGRELIGKHYRSFTDKVELTGANDGPVEFTEIRRTIVDPAAKP